MATSQSAIVIHVFYFFFLKSISNHTKLGQVQKNVFNTHMNVYDHICTGSTLQNKSHKTAIYEFFVLIGITNVTTLPLTTIHYPTVF